MLRRDSNTLAMLRFKNKLLTHAVDFVGPKMRNIIMIPPMRKPKDQIKITEVFEEDIHKRVTRANLA